MEVKSLRSERLEARVTPEQKSMFALCARIRGCSVSDFVVSCAQEVASRTIREQEVMALSRRDRQIFVEALLDEAEPGERLKKAAKRYLASR